MRQVKPYVAGIVFLLLLVIPETIYFVMYRMRSSEHFEQCLEQDDQISKACSQIINAADSAYFWATANHVFSYFIIFFVFIFLTSRISKLEERLNDLAGRKDV